RRRHVRRHRRNRRRLFAGRPFFSRRRDDPIRGHALQDQDGARDQRHALLRAQTDLLVARWVANPKKNVAHKRRKKQRSWRKFGKPSRQAFARKNSRRRPEKARRHFAAAKLAAPQEGQMAPNIVTTSL